jgi:predicted nucleic acid-binding protein
MTLVDTSGLLAALDPTQSRHREASAALRAARRPLLLSPFILTELDYMIRSRIGRDAGMSMLAEVGRGAYVLEPFSSADVAVAHSLIERYADLRISLADASLVVLAERHGTRDILTLDERHFRVLKAGRKSFRLLPADG